MKNKDVETFKQRWDAFLDAYSKILKENNELRKQIERLKNIRSLRG